jgi:aminoglycoside 6'-N-acetyltransferase I
MTEIEILLLGSSDVAVLDRVAPEVFDHPVRREWCAELLADPRHLLVVARGDGVVVGMASGVHYLHPDKAPQLFVNEVGVAETHRGQGVARRMLQRLVERATELGCTEAWVLTDADNAAANRLYAAAGGTVPPEPCVMYTIPIRRQS